MSQNPPYGYGDREGGTRRNIRIGKRRTSIKLEPEMWDALAEICTRTKKNLNEICTEVHGASGVSDPAVVPGCANFTSELRVFILDFYRAAARQGGLEVGV